MRVTTMGIFMLLHLAAIMTLVPVGAAAAANAVLLPASEPQTIYYTTNGAAPVETISNTSVTFTVPEQEIISLVPNAGKGKPFFKYQKQKIHESKREFEKHVKEKHGNRFKVMEYSANQSENGLKGHIFLVENKNSDILQLGSFCNEEERTKRVAIIKEFILNNPDLIGLTGNEELRERGLERNHCGNFYFDRYVNGYKLEGSVFHFGFEPQWNFSVSVNLRPITSEMYLAAQENVFLEGDIATIVYKDQNIAIPDKKNKSDNTSQKLQELQMHKYLRNREPYAIWEVRGKYIYEINAVTGEIASKQLNIKY